MIPDATAATSAAMASLTVGVDAPSDHRWSGALPVQARDVYKLVVAATGVSGRQMKVPAGRYLVTALLPSGEVATVEDIVELAAGEDRTVKLSVPTLDVPVNLSNKTTFADSVKAFARPVTDLFSSHTFAIVTGNWLAGRGNARHPAITREPTTRSSIEVAYPATESWIEIAGKDGCTYLAIPVDGNRSTIVQWSVNEETGDVDVNFDFKDGELNAFYDFIRNDQAQGARTIGQSIIAQSEQFIMDKERSPLRALLGAYVLLRANELEGMDVWTDNLVNWFTWLPDALAVRVEYLARKGDHAKASKLLLDAPNRGVPWFRSGIGYLESRSRVYASVGASKRSSLPLADDELVKIGNIAKKFGELATALDMSNWSTVLRGVKRVA